MRRLKQFEPLVIHDFEEKVFHMESHAHTYFELGYIYTGNGIHHLNNSTIEYYPGDLFLICPEDSHTFTIKKSTRFVFIKFTDAYFDLFGKLEKQGYLELEPTQVMRNKLLKEKKLQISHPSSIILKNMIDNIVLYDCSSENISFSPVIFHQILSIISLVKEMLGEMNSAFSQTAPGEEQLITYVHDHIYEPALIQIKNIAQHFNIAPNYFGAYFKRMFGTSYSEYVNNYKASLIEMRMQSKQFTLKQIADEFGFTDESHLSRFFKRHHLVSPGAYRKK
jgi:AraC-like DNA-binding protein